MKKPKKLSIRKMDQYQVINEIDQLKLKGGYDPGAMWEWALNELGYTADQVTQVIEDGFESISNCVNATGQILWNNLDTIAAELLNRSVGGTSPLGAPIIIFENTSDYYGISNYNYLNPMEN